MPSSGPFPFNGTGQARVLANPSRSLCVYIVPEGIKVELSSERDRSGIG